MSEQEQPSSGLRPPALMSPATMLWTGIAVAAGAALADRLLNDWLYPAIGLGASMAVNTVLYPVTQFLAVGGAVLAAGSFVLRAVTAARRDG